jgi:hypothetical protein
MIDQIVAEYRIAIFVSSSAWSENEHRGGGQLAVGANVMMHGRFPLEVASAGSARTLLRR